MCFRFDWFGLYILIQKTSSQICQIMNNFSENVDSIMDAILKFFDEERKWVFPPTWMLFWAIAGGALLTALSIVLTGGLVFIPPSTVVIAAGGSGAVLAAGSGMGIIYSQIARFQSIANIFSTILMYADLCCFIFHAHTSPFSLFLSHFLLVHSQQL